MHSQDETAPRQLSLLQWDLLTVGRGFRRLAAYLAWLQTC